MALDDIQKLIFEVADLKRRLGQMVRVGSVEEVKSGSGEQKLRMKLGKDGQGEDILSPWLHSSDHRGGAREEARYKKGQNVMLIAPNGDWRQAQIFPYAENDKHKRPDHATDSSESYQYEHLRESRTKTSHELWLADDESQQQGSGGEAGSGQGGGESQKVTDSDKSVALIRIGKKPKQKQQQQAGGASGAQEQQEEEEKPKGVLLLKFKESVTFQVGEKTFVKITDGKIDAYVDDSHSIIEAEKITHKSKVVVLQVEEKCLLGGEDASIQVKLCDDSCATKVYAI
ncbi:phage baseplate assembly protein V [Bradyrhizobium paxllaeri]|uniref:phage baseplate assembly protein V n=1 Tax=Bradyrhizobium paxllaeri TaxID=190148 RepID=UPI000810C9EC|nr:phage baseplate assembly protein V [Bradyrhizobium paxllaeri]